MKEFVISEAKTETAVLVALITPQQDEAKTKEYLDELEFLAETAGARTVRCFTQRANGPSQVSYVGSGKLQEIRQYIKNCQDAYDEWLKAEGEEWRENTSANKTNFPQPSTPNLPPSPVGMVIFDDELSAKQLRNIERSWA